VVRWARTDPSRLVIGIDANTAAMRSAARRAKGLPNAAFVVAAAESLPDDLAGVADRVTVQFPFGSLLRGILCADGPVLANLARIAAPGATLTVVWSVVDRDRAAIGPEVPLRPSEERFAAVGLDIRALRPASPAELSSTGSTWAKRLGAGADRPVTLLRAVRRERTLVQNETASCR
jgi:16S rRNA (adenine(1408)-N(1))-methyltransferase